jgi:hypothetical protein
VASVDFLATEVKGFGCKKVNIDRRSKRRCPASTGNGDIDAGLDDVGQLMTGRGRGQAESAARRSIRNLEEVLIRLRGACPLVEPTSDLLNGTLISERIQPLRRNSGSPRCGS